MSDDDAPLTIEQAAAQMGISRASAYRHVSAGELDTYNAAGPDAKRLKLRTTIAAIRKWRKRRAIKV